MCHLQPSQPRCRIIIAHLCQCILHRLSLQNQHFLKIKKKKSYQVHVWGLLIHCTCDRARRCISPLTHRLVVVASKPVLIPSIHTWPTEEPQCLQAAFVAQCVTTDRQNPLITSLLVGQWLPVYAYERLKTLQKMKSFFSFIGEFGILLVCFGKLVTPPPPLKQFMSVHVH